MCNLYSMTKNQDAIRNLFKVSQDRTGNMPLLTGIFPDMLALVVRTSRDGERVLEMMRWGFPPPPAFPQSQHVTNVRNTMSNYWRGWLEPRFRCLVPATSFCEWTDTRPKITHWFARARVDHCSRSPESGGRGPAYAAPSRRQSRASTCSIQFSHARRTTWCGRYTRRRCPSS